MEIQTVVKEAHSHPVVVSVDHPLSYLFLEEELELFEDELHLESALDDPSVIFDQNVAITDATSMRVSKYPKVTLDHSPLSPALNEIIGVRYKDLDQYLTTQRDMKSRVLNEVSDEDVVVLMIADGLGYEDVKGTQLEGEPCLVNGPTVTPVGYQNIVYGRDQIPLANDLSRRGFMRRRGYSYWDDSSYNDLNDKVFRHFGDDITRVRTTHEIIQDLRQRKLSSHRTFIQISRRVLDSHAHDGKEVRSSDISHEVGKLSDDIDRLCATLDKQVESYLFVLTADHGILWREEFESEMNHITSHGASRMRYAPQKIGVDCPAHLIDAYGETYTVLEYPFVTKPFANDEGGTHGGISYQESIVPLLMRNSGGRI